MKHLYKLPILVLVFLLFTACKKQKFDTTGKLVFNFKNGIPSCYSLYTEAAYTTSHLTIFSSGGSTGALDVTWDGNTMTINGLNYGTYVFTGCAVGTRVVQVSAGGTKTYNL
ncbi:MAG TPA: hypothetical protein VIM79_10030 [Niastella sp.]